MSDAPTPPASASPPTDPAHTPKRPWTILGRLTQAVREQNWFAVVLELAIVVLGVVIGFQVTAWGQGRADQAKERAYLQQLAQDLRETEELILWAETESLPYDAATLKLVQAFFAPVPPPPDSVFQWRRESMFYRPLLPVTGTADALIASGDLALIQNDSLRSEITTYVPIMKSRLAVYEGNIQTWWEASVFIANRYDLGDMFVRTMDREMVDSVAVASPLRFLLAGDWQSPFPVDVAAMLADQDAYNGFRRMLEEKSGMRSERRFTVNATRLLREQVEAELDRRWQIPPVPLTGSIDGSFADRVFEGR